MSGTEIPPDHLAIDLDALNPYLRNRVEGLGQILEAVKFKGGQSNPTYRLTGSQGVRVLRRKPPGRLVNSAHDIHREYRVLQGLGRAGTPVPRPDFYCADSSIIGSEFYIVEYVEGRVFWEADAPELSRDDRVALYAQMNAVLADLHDIDPAAIGLADLGRPAGYLDRNFARWSGLYTQSVDEPIPEMDALIAALPAQLPQGGPATLLHGDYGLYNIIVDSDRPRLRAVLDWEMATIGDPFVDLAHHLRAWWDSPDPQGGAATSLAGLDLAALGIPTMDDYIAAYCARRKIATPDMRVYLAFAQFRYAAMMQGILKRAQDGTAASRRVLHRRDRIVAIAKTALNTLEGGASR